ncbi:hypothetical protein ACFQ0G_21930 [Streptomyces chiangmaiensis]
MRRLRAVRFPPGRPAGRRVPMAALLALPALLVLAVVGAVALG